MRPLFFSLFLSILLVRPACARIGETSLQFVDRYGPPRDSKLTKISDNGSPLVEGAIHHTYEYHGWKIRAAFLQLDGPAVRMDFQKLGGRGLSPTIQDYELQAIMAANTPAGMSWQRVAYDNPNSPNRAFNKITEALAAEAFGEKVWERTDGTLLWLRINLMVRLELPAAREYEQRLKALGSRGPAPPCRNSKQLSLDSFALPES